MYCNAYLNAYSLLTSLTVYACSLHLFTNLKHSAFSKTRAPPKLWWVPSCKSPAVFLHFLLMEKGPRGPFYRAPAGASKRETPTSNITERTDRVC